MYYAHLTIFRISRTLSHFICLIQLGFYASNSEITVAVGYFVISELKDYTEDYTK